ncbi:TonB-dependent receptor [Rheinheimera maricola]|uniref:TonB-dependent receptor n=1 Tax=Rheinheimera maricola TaxID=2793282 RepID=A0ABS7X625_9GAMM|nr:TonB-dependent receptor [Rheinheimera maricola]MBZ9610984.1 TonB-dependent receptor [Rheinheimera maricola]
MRSLSALPRYSLLAALISLTFSASAQDPAQRYDGVITDTQGQPLKNARVHIHGRQQYVYADEQGRFSIQAPANAELHVSAAGYGDSFVTVKPAQPQLNINLTPGGIERIVVAASGIHKYNLEMATPVSVLTGEELSRRTEPTIGETLKYEPGVHANYYGPVASSPVIRGLDGPRVRILNNGLDTADVSRIGPDHAISADAITAQQIEVLRGPATLLYGSGAIGGVINVVDNRIPRQLRADSETKLETRYVDVSDEKTVALNHEGSSNNIAWHVDGFNRDAADYNVPRFSNDEGETATRLENSWTKSNALNGGLSYIGDRGLFGFSIGRLESDYGIPGHHHHEDEHEEEHEEEHDAQDDEHAHEDEGVFAKLKQNRLSMAGEWYTPFTGIETLAFNAAYTDYQHQEIEGGSVGTTFKNKALESRLSLEHEELGGWHGLVGYHLQHADYRAFGEEAFTPDSETLSHAIFVLEEKQFGNISAQLGGRIEHTTHDATGLTIGHDTDITLPVSDDFTAVSASAGLVWEFVPGFSWALALSRSERAPGAAELYSNGAHIATSSYELGMRYQIHDGEIELSEQLSEKETANNVDITFRSFKGDLSFTYNFFYNKVHNYLYLADTGLTMADLAHDEHEEEHADAEHDAHESFAVYQYQQHDATLYGLEFEARYRLDAAQSVNVFVDTVRAKLDGGDYLPRIPPYKTGVGYQYNGISWSADLGVTRYAKQNKVAANETPTKGYTLLDASLNYDFSLSQLDITAFLRGTNLTNELGFVHSSFIKANAPLPGRAITLGLRATF